MRPSADVIVVGCGVAGATAAETAASLGSKVLVVEEHDRVGIPSHCSGHIGIRSVKRLRVQPPENVIKNEIRGAVFHSPSDRVLRLERRTPITWVLDRKGFDEHLAARAKRAGAEILLNRKAVSIQTIESDLVQVRVSNDDEPSTVSCRVLVDCEGVAPRLAPVRTAAQRRKSMWVNSAQVHVDRVSDLERDMVEVYLGSDYAPGFFAWIIPWRDGSAKVGLATREGNARVLLERFMKKHPHASRKLKRIQGHDASFHPIPLGGPVPKTFYPEMLVAGDAAQQVKPTTGGGIVFGLICGRAAGQVAHEASISGDVSERSLSRYERLWKRDIGADLDAMRRIRRMLFRLPDRYLERIFSVARSLDVAAVLSQADDIDMQGRTLARLGLNPRLTLSMLYSSVLALPFLGESDR